MQTDELVADLITVSGPLPCDRVGLTAGLAKLRTLKAALDAIELRYINALAMVSPTLEGDTATAARVGIGAANKLVKRAKTAAQLPEFADALANGDITAAHIDAIADVIRREEPATQRELIARSAELADTASDLTVSEFRKATIDTARAISRDQGVTRLRRQRRDTTCRTWTDATTGMWHLNATFDPELAVRLSRQLNAALDRRYTSEPPPSTPSDPIAKQDHLRAHALADIILGRIGEAEDSENSNSGNAPEGEPEPPNTSRHRPVRVKPGPPEVLVVWETTKPLAHIDWGLDVDLPPTAITDLLARTDITTVHYLTTNGVIVDGPGNLNLDRTTRLANRVQRRALRAMYRTCAIPGCTITFDKCRIHHIIWWEHGGLSNLDNLIPVCPHHHTHIHEHHWQLHLTPDRTLTIHNQHDLQLFPPAGPNRTRPNHQARQHHPPPPPPMTSTHDQHPPPTPTRHPATATRARTATPDEAHPSQRTAPIDPLEAPMRG